MLTVEAEGLEKTYHLGFGARKVVHALRGLSLKVEAGQVFGLIGPNGAGKSTAIKILLNLVHATKGKARIFGLDVAERRSREGLGYVPENPAPYEYLTGREFVTLSAKLSGVAPGELSRRVGESLERVALGKAADLRIRRYSKGMVQRTVLAAALVSSPKLLVLDEPTSGLDPIGRKLVRDLILEERRRGTTVFFCTHVISDVETVCDQLAVLVAGQCVKEGTVASLLSGQAPRLEVLIEGLTEAQLSGLAELGRVTALGARLLLDVSESQLDALIGGVIEKGGRVLRIVPVRFSLEDVFLEALQASGGPKVGGLIE